MKFVILYEWYNIIYIYENEEKNWFKWKFIFSLKYVIWNEKTKKINGCFFSSKINLD